MNITIEGCGGASSTTIRFVTWVIYVPHLKTKHSWLPPFVQCGFSSQR